MGLFNRPSEILKTVKNKFSSFGRSNANTLKTVNTKSDIKASLTKNKRMRKGQSGYIDGRTHIKHFGTFTPIKHSPAYRPAYAKASADRPASN